MHIQTQTTDEAVIEEIGARLRQARLARNQSQASLAEQAGIGRVTLQRLEEGGTGASLPSLIRVLRALGLSEGLDRLVPESAPSPIEEAERHKRRRKRAGSPRTGTPGEDGSQRQPWRWGDEQGKPQP
jgi:transcriptional regulator with XRE-family HTH domain